MQATTTRFADREEGVSIQFTFLVLSFSDHVLTDAHPISMINVVQEIT